jgi:Trypsin
MFLGITQDLGLNIDTCGLVAIETGLIVRRIKRSTGRKEPLDFIIGGEAAKEAQFPWHGTVSVIFEHKYDVCGATLISKNAVLTS